MKVGPLLALLASVLALGVATAVADHEKAISQLVVCDRMESEGRLLYQQFKKTKACRESDIGKGWTDCHFKAYGTEILLVGAVGTTVQERMSGILGSGFYVLSVDESTEVRFLVDKHFGPLVRVDSKDELKESGCDYDQAYITLDAQVRSPGELNEAEYGLVKLPQTQEEKTQALQKDLKMLGYYTGSIDGVLGPKTISAIENYKRAKGLEKEAPLEIVRQSLTVDAARKSLDDLKRLYEERTVPRPPLKK